LRAADRIAKVRIYNGVNASGAAMRLLRQASIELCLAILAVLAQAQPATETWVRVKVVDEVGVPVPSAQVSVAQADSPGLSLQTDYAGRVRFALKGDAPYRIRVSKAGFYQSVTDDADPHAGELQISMHHEQIISEQVSVAASVPGINPEQVSDKLTLNVPEITNVPYPTSRDIRNLLPFYPGVVQDESGQVHVAGSETWATLDLLDGFDIRSPMSGNLALRVSADAVRSIDQESTRYPVEFGRATGGVIAFYTGMGDNKFRFNTTNFVPSFQQKNGIRFDKFVPRLTFSGPVIPNRAWFFDGLEFEYDNIYVPELPKNANTNLLLRGSNLIKFQANLSPANILTLGLLANAYHSPYDGLSALAPQESTTKRNTTAWMPYARDQLSLGNGALLEGGVGVVRIRDGYEPYPDGPFRVTPEQTLGSFFATLTGRSRRVEGNASL